MSYFAIGDEETVTGFRLVGVEGRVARTPADTREALTVALGTEGVNIIVITERLAAEVQAELSRYYSLNFPLIIQIPDRAGPSGKQRSIHDIIKAAVGVTI
ncbi:MAG: V-type ATP synthase subunit F [Candidatus Aureabacteria bacterium]|nr:V-type ATP synthase subunit F [Candidatus Auribacterota bacterium]